MMKYEVHIYKDASQKPSIIKTVSGDITAARRAQIREMLKIPYPASTHYYSSDIFRKTGEGLTIAGQVNKYSRTGADFYQAYFSPRKGDLIACRLDRNGRLIKRFRPKGGIENEQSDRKDREKDGRKDRHQNDSILSHSRRQTQQNA